jgi:hypothetical protein
MSKARIMTLSTEPTIWFSAPASVANSPNSTGEHFMDLFCDPSAVALT